MNTQKLRLDKGWSQEDLAMNSGISVRTVQRIENGKRVWAVFGIWRWLGTATTSKAHESTRQLGRLGSPGTEASNYPFSLDLL
jgi:hypothetical protein